MDQQSVVVYQLVVEDIQTVAADYLERYDEKHLYTNI
jgi:hypothetical protein